MAASSSPPAASSCASAAPLRCRGQRRHRPRLDLVRVEDGRVKFDQERSAAWNIVAKKPSRTKIRRQFQARPNASPFISHVPIIILLFRNLIDETIKIKPKIKIKNQASMFIDEIKVFARRSRRQGPSRSIAKRMCQGRPERRQWWARGNVILQADHDLNNLINQFYVSRLIAQKANTAWAKAWTVSRAGSHHQSSPAARWWRLCPRTTNRWQRTTKRKTPRILTTNVVENHHRQTSRDPHSGNRTGDGNRFE